MLPRAMDVPQGHGEWLTRDEIRVKYEMDGPFLENALKYMKKKTVTKYGDDDTIITQQTFYQATRREKITVVSTPVTDANTEPQ